MSMRVLGASVLGGGTAVVLAATLRVTAAQGGSPDIPMDGDDIAGVVTGAKGPEAGVWVIAETRDLPTPFVRIVVTDEQGR